MKRIELPSGIDIASCIDLSAVVAKADGALSWPLVHITDERTPHTKGGPHDYTSNGDYWWPNPNTPDGLPYVVRDGRTNPANFNAHRLALRKMRYAVTHLAGAFRITGKECYARQAVQWLREFFLEPSTRMNPHLSYAQAIPGVCDGRGVGIIDTLHLIDVPVAIARLRDAMGTADYEGLRKWFADYLAWMNTHPNGLEERDWYNNHSVTWFAQAAAYARFTEDAGVLHMCRERFRRVLLPAQMARDGSFPHELARTKAYCYSCFVLDNLFNICLFASVPEDDLWAFTLPDGRGLRRGLDFLMPYLWDKSTWPYGRDAQHDELWPVAMPFLLFAGLRYGREDCVALWKSLDQSPGNEEIRRNIAIRCPALFFI